MSPKPAKELGFFCCSSRWPGPSTSKASISLALRSLSGKPWGSGQPTLHTSFFPLLPLPHSPSLQPWIGCFSPPAHLLLCPPALSPHFPTPVLAGFRRVLSLQLEARCSFHSFPWTQLYASSQHSPLESGTRGQWRYGYFRSSGAPGPSGFP